MSSRLTKFLAVLLALTMVAVACGSDSDDAAESGNDEAAAGDLDCSLENLDLFADGKLTIATGEPVFPPWMIDDDPTNGQGFESAVAYALAEEMGFAAADVEWVRTDFDVAIAPGDKDYDFNMQQYSPTAERDEFVDFSVSYYDVQKSVLTFSGSPVDGAASFDDLEAGTWGATIGTTDLDYIEGEIGISDVAVYDTQSDVVAAMMAGQIDATVVGLPSAFYLSAVELDGGTIAGVLPAAGADSDGTALLMPEGSSLKGCVDVAINSLRDAGTLDAIGEEWLQGGGDIPSIGK